MFVFMLKNFYIESTASVESHWENVSIVLVTQINTLKTCFTQLKAKNTPEVFTADCFYTTAIASNIKFCLTHCVPSSYIQDTYKNFIILQGYYKIA